RGGPAGAKQRPTPGGNKGGEAGAERPPPQGCLGYLHEVAAVPARTLAAAAGAAAGAGAGGSHHGVELGIIQLHRTDRMRRQASPRLGAQAPTIHFILPRTNDI